MPNYNGTDREILYNFVLELSKSVNLNNHKFVFILHAFGTQNV